MYLVNQAFLDDTECRNCTTHSEIYHLWTESRQSATLDKLDSSRCLSEYGVTIQSRRLNLLLVTNEHPASITINGSSFYYEGIANGTETWINNTNVYTIYRFNAVQALDPYETGVTDHWVFSGTIDNKTKVPALDEFIRAPDTWRVGTTGRQWPVEYCLSERAVSHCKLYFNSVVAVIITCLNFCE